MTYSQADNRDLFGDFKFREDGNASNMLVEVCEFISSHNLPPLYILIDEYDNFTNQLLVVYKDSLYQDLTTGESFLRTFFKVIKAEALAKEPSVPASAQEYCLSPWMT